MTELKRMVHAFERTAEGCIALALFAPPFFFGGRCALGQLLLALLVSLAAGFCLLGRLGSDAPCLWWPCPEFLLPAAALVVSSMMWMRLPEPLVRALAPGISRLLPAWTDKTPTGLGSSGWRYLSMCPGLSKEATLLFLVYTVLFWATLGSVRTPAAAARVLKVFFLSGLVVAGVGLAHYWFGNGRYYGFWEPWWVKPAHHLRVPFTNRNHFAGYLVLTLAPGILWLGRLWRRPDSELPLLLAGAALALVLAAVLLAQSRAGILLGLGTTALSMGIFFRFDRLSAGPVVICIVGGCAVALALSLQHDDSFRRLRFLFAGNQSLDELVDHRFRLWQADLHAIIDFPLFGSGTASHGYVCPLYFTSLEQFTYTHAENCYVQILMECGLLGLTLLGAALLALGRRAFAALRSGCARLRDQAGFVACTCTISLAAALLHALVDFVWYVPAYAAAVAVLCGLLCNHGCFNVPRNAGRVTRRVPRIPAWIIRPSLAVVWLALTVVLVSHYVHCMRAEAAWYDYYALLLSEPKLPRLTGADAFHFETGRQGPEGLTPTGTSAPDYLSSLQQLDERARFLQSACRQRTADPDYHYRLGLIAEEEFLVRSEQKGRPYTLPQLRQAFEAHSSLTGEDRHRWRMQTCGADLELLEQAQDHFRQSLRCCPLLAGAYLHLAELCFLDESPEDPAAYCRQAVLVRPQEPRICLQAGLESWREGNYDLARQCWHRAWGLNPEIMEVFAGPAGGLGRNP
jgi:O-antigen ligase